LDQLKLYRHEPETGLVASIPCEDIGLVVVDQPSATFSLAALARLVDFGAAVVICGRNHLPNGMLLPLANHTEVVWRIHDQIAVSKPVRKQLWKQIVAAKVRGQATNLEPGSAVQRRLLALAREVKSGDPSNIEAQAAKLYWTLWLGEPSPAGDPLTPNPSPPRGRGERGRTESPHASAVTRTAPTRSTPCDHSDDPRPRVRYLRRRIARSLLQARATKRTPSTPRNRDRYCRATCPFRCRVLKTTSGSRLSRMNVCTAPQNRLLIGSIRAEEG